jgi:FAD/FMN-containing dehydrogenase
VRRRSVLKMSLALPILYAGSGLPARSKNAPGVRRVRPADPGWPSAEEWSSLRKALKGELQIPVPLLADCALSPHGESCTATIGRLRNPYYIGDQASGTQVSGWLNAWEPSLSAYAVACRSAEDVVEAVNFARKHRLRLVVKGGGHSYQGTSNAPDSLLVWTRPMASISLNDGFVAAGCEGLQEPFHAVTVQAGAVWMDVYNAVTTQGGRYVQGGGCATVGVAGLVQSGGFGSFSKGFGTAAGSLLEAHIVTADGRHRTANPKMNPELFWALKGGGGGSFGVVTQLTLRTHELPDFFGGAEGTIEAASNEDFHRLLARFVSFYADNLCNPHWGESISIGQNNTLKISMVCQGLDEASARASWQPFFAWVAASPGAFKITDELWAGVRPARGWWDAQSRRGKDSTSFVFDDRPDSAPTHAWWSGDQEQVGAFLYGYDSIWLPASLLRHREQARLAEALFASSRQIGFELHFNKGLAGAPPAAIERARDTATNSAVLDAFALAIVATGGPSRYPGLPGPKLDNVAAARDAAAIDRAMVTLRMIAPRAGSYVSESNYFNSSWKRAFWGSHVDRLVRIKESCDPDGLFFVHHGIGSEKWSADGFTRLA